MTARTRPTPLCEGGVLVIAMFIKSRRVAKQPVLKPSRPRKSKGRVAALPTRPCSHGLCGLTRRLTPSPRQRGARIYLRAATFIITPTTYSR